LVGAPAFQALLYFASGVDFDTFSRFAFVAGVITEYVAFLVVWRFLRQRGMGLAEIGFVRRAWKREALIGVVMGIVLIVLAGFGAFYVEQILPSTVSRDPRPTWAAIVYGLALVTAFAPLEEIIWRGYAIRMLEEATRSRAAAVLLAAVGFGVLHWWGGPSTIVMATVMGLAFSALFLWRKTLVACISAHLVLDLPLLVFMLFPVAPPGGA